MITVVYTPSFLRQFNKLAAPLQDEVEEKILAFRRDPRHPSLRAHKLHGELKGCWSLSVNYQFRIVFSREKKGEAVLLAVGNHAVYS